MPPDPTDLVNLLDERRQLAERVLSTDGALREYYNEWKQRWVEMDHAYAGRWEVIWPDKVITTALPKIPNFIALAAEDRGRAVAAIVPSVLVPQDKTGDSAKHAAEKRERILAGYWDRNRVPFFISRWAMDAMMGGLAATRVWMDTSLPRRDRFPIYKRIDGRFCFPSPIFTEGPFVDDMIVGYEEKLASVEKRFGIKLPSLAEIQKKDRLSDRVRVIEYYDESWVSIVVELPARQGRDRRYEAIVVERHDLGVCPVTIGTRPTADGIYRGDFEGTLATLNTFNKLMTMHLDAAAMYVYPERKILDIENPEEAGPDATIRLEGQNSVYEYVAPPPARFENHQLMRLMDEFSRLGTLMPPARTGDPNESIISAAGISAAQSQYMEHVRSLQRLTIAPMLEAANEVALRWDEKAGEAVKEIAGTVHGQAFRETYRPSKDINKNYRNTVVYPPGSGLDEINQAVKLQQLRGSGLLSRRRALELLPETENPLEAEKQMALEHIDDAIFAGLVAQANAGTLAPEVLAAVRKSLESDNKSLHEAILAATPTTPLAAVPGSAPGSPPSRQGAPGTAGAARGRAEIAESNLPALEQLIVGGRP